MNHTEFDFYDDLTVPLYNFLQENDINIDYEDGDAISQFP